MYLRRSFSATRRKTTTASEVLILDYYDIAYETCGITKDLEADLGYKRIFIAGKDVSVVDGNHYKNNEIEGSIFINTEKSNILAVLNMSPCAVVLSDSRIDKKAMEQMKEKRIALCIPFSAIISSYGLQRSRGLYMTSKLLDHAKSIKLDVAFVTLSKTKSNLCSYMQLLELAKLIGADEDHARQSLSTTNRSLVMK